VIEKQVFKLIHKFTTNRKNKEEIDKLAKGESLPVPISCDNSEGGLRSFVI